MAAIKSPVASIVTILTTAIAFSSARTDVQASTNCGYRWQDFADSVRAISSSLKFYENNLEDMTMDVGLGTAIVEAHVMGTRVSLSGQLELLLNTHANIPTAAFRQLKSLKERAKDITFYLIERLQSTLLEETDGKIDQYASDSILWLNDTSVWVPTTEWKSPDILEKLTTVGNPNANLRRRDKINEQVSDYCISRLFETCDIEDKCAPFTTYGTLDYTLTHQILYLIVANKKNCFANAEFLRKMRVKTFEEATTKQCATLYQEMKDRLTNSKKLFLYRDLFAEQAVVCGILGYPNVLNPLWLRKHFQMQDKEFGCFLYYRDEVDHVMTPDEKSKYAHKITKRADSFLLASKRKVCSSHLTAVKIGAIAVHLRHFTDTCLQHSMNPNLESSTKVASAQ